MPLLELEQHKSGSEKPGTTCGEYPVPPLFAAGEVFCEDVGARSPNARERLGIVLMLPAVALIPSLGRHWELFGGLVPLLCLAGLLFMVPNFIGFDHRRLRGSAQRLIHELL